jgi:hypothetical protein
MSNTAFCPNCGKSVALPEGRGDGFCPSCGSKVAAGGEGSAADTAVSASGHAPPVTPKPPVKPKIHIPKIFITIGAVAVVVIVAAVIAIPALAGNSYQRAEANFLKTITGVLPAVSSAGGGKLDFTAGYSPARWMQDEVDIPDMGLAGTLAYTEQQLAANLAFTSDGDKVSDIAFAYDGDAVTLALPELTQYFLRFPIGGGDSDAGIDMSKLDQKKLENTLTEIAKTYFKVTKDISEVEKGAELTGGGVTVKCDKYTIVFTEETVSQILLAAIGELRKNDNLMDFIASIGAASSNGYYDADEISDEIEDALDELEDMLSDFDDDDRLFRMTVWIKGGEVISRKIDKIPDSNATFSYQKLLTKNAAYYEFEAKIDSRNSASLTGEFEKSGGAWNGTAKVSIKEYGDEFVAAKIKCSSIKFSGDQIQGEVGVSGDFAYEDISFDFDVALGKDGSRQTVKIGGDIEETYYGEKYDIGELTLSYAYDKGGKPSMPKYDDRYAVDPSDYEDEDNIDRASDMAEELRDLLDDGEFEDNELLEELVWELWYMVRRG